MKKAGILAEIFGKYSGQVWQQQVALGKEFWRNLHAKTLSAKILGKGSRMREMKTRLMYDIHIWRNGQTMKFGKWLLKVTGRTKFPVGVTKFGGQKIQIPLRKCQAKLFRTSRISAYA